MYISKKKTYKILAYCAMSAILVSGGVASAEDDSNNTVVVTDSTITRNGTVTNYNGTTQDVNAGETTNGNSNSNTITVNGGTITRFLNGGYSHSNGNTNYNFVTVNNGTFGSWVEGGWATTGNANYNTLIINGGTFNGTIVDGGYTWTGNTNYNTVTINGGTFNLSSSGGIYGGYVVSSGNAIGNVINIKGGTFNGNIYSGTSGTGNTVADNVINIYGSPNLTNASLFAARGGNSSNNSINIYTKDITAKNIGGFENLNFYLPADVTNGTTILTLTDPSGTISDNITLFRNANENLNEGDTITLLTTTSENGLTFGSTNNASLAYGVSLEYPLNLTEVLNDSGNVGSLQATIGNLNNATLKDQTEEFTAPVIDEACLLDSGTDRLLEWLPPEGINDINSMPTTGFDPFLGIGGSSRKINTGNDTKLRTKSGGISFGMARYLKNRHGTLIFAPVTDYGQDFYESTLSDANQTKGHGHSKYFMAGLIARQISTHGMYYEASMRYGRVRTNFLSNNFLVHNIPTSVDYAASTPCYAGHVRIGWRDHISKQNILDAYGIYSFNRVNGFRTRVSTGEDYSFSNVNSGRMQIGARLTREIKEKHSFYSGIAFIHEFTGETYGEYMGMHTKKAGLKGNTGLIELGWQFKPSQNSVTMLDTSLTAWIGDQKGFTVSAKLKRDF